MLATIPYVFEMQLTHRLETGNRNIHFPSRWHVNFRPWQLKKNKKKQTNDREQIPPFCVEQRDICHASTARCHCWILRMIPGRIPWRCWRCSRWMLVVEMLQHRFFRFRQVHTVGRRTIDGSTSRLIDESRTRKRLSRNTSSLGQFTRQPACTLFCPSLVFLLSRISMLRSTRQTGEIRGKNWVFFFSSFQIGYVQFTCMWRWLPSVSRSFLLTHNGRLCNSSSTFHFNWKCWAFCGFYGTQSLDHYWPASWPFTIGFKRALNDKVGEPISWCVLRMTLFGITFLKTIWFCIYQVQNFFGDSVRTIKWGTIGWDLKGEMLFPNPN